MNSQFRVTLLAAATWVVLSPGVAHAYVDPGSAGFIVTTVLGFLSAVGYIVRGYFHRLRQLIRHHARKSDTG